MPHVSQMQLHESGESAVKQPLNSKCHAKPKSRPRIAMPPKKIIPIPQELQMQPAEATEKPHIAMPQMSQIPHKLSDSPDLEIGNEQQICWKHDALSLANDVETVASAASWLAGIGLLVTSGSWRLAAIGFVVTSMVTAWLLGLVTHTNCDKEANCREGKALLQLSNILRPWQKSYIKKEIKGILKASCTGRTITTYANCKEGKGTETPQFPQLQLPNKKRVRFNDQDEIIMI